MLQRILNFLEKDRQYFQSCKREITAQNHHMMLDGCVIYASVLLFYTILTGITEQPAILSKMYYAFDVVHVCLCVAVFANYEKNKKNFRSTQVLCAILEWSVLSFFVLEAVYTSQTQHSLYVPIAILLVLLLYIHGALYVCVMLFVYTASYAVLSCLYKTRDAYVNDLYIACATFIASAIGYVLIARLRHSEGAALLKYERLSQTDSLTGLLNKSAIETLCARVISETNHACAFIIVDLDDFKLVNDAYGHDVGDNVLVSVGRALQDCFRDVDSIGRFGGDEFIVLMDNCKNPEIAAEHVKNAIEQINRLRFLQTDLALRCSVGIAMKRKDDSFHSIFKRADQALYTAKARYKGGYYIIRD